MTAGEWWQSQTLTAKKIGVFLSLYCRIGDIEAVRISSTNISYQGTMYAFNVVLKRSLNNNKIKYYRIIIEFIIQC